MPWARRDVWYIPTAQEGALSRSRQRRRNSLVRQGDTNTLGRSNPTRAPTAAEIPQKSKVFQRKNREISRKVAGFRAWVGWLITQRSRVQIPPPQPIESNPGRALCAAFFVARNVTGLGQAVLCVRSLERVRGAFLHRHQRRSGTPPRATQLGRISQLDSQTSPMANCARGGVRDVRRSTCS
jgi:hypothetical protein